MREVQVDTIYNVAQLIDWPAQGHDLDDDTELELSVALSHSGTPPAPMLELHSSLMERDPAGRHGEPRTLVLRQWQMLAQDIGEEIKTLLRDKQYSVAAVLWKKHAGGELKDALAAVQALERQLRP